MLVEMHAHVIPNNFPSSEGRDARWPSMDHFEPGRANVMIGRKNFRTVHSGNWDVGRRLEDMQKSGVDVEVVSPLPELTSYWFSEADGLDICRYVNEFIMALCNAAQGKFYGLGIVPMQAPDSAVRELESIKRLGLAGIELGTHVNGKSLGAEEFRPVFQEAERLGLAVFVHSANPTFIERIGGRLANSVGYPTETGLTIASLIDSGTADACPDLRIAFSHGGGTFPFMLPRMQNAYAGTWNDEPPSVVRAANMDPIRKAPIEYARRFYYDTLVFDSRAIRYLIDTIGVSQLLVGTDYPYMQREAPVGKTLRAMDLPQVDVEAICWDNCWRFLGIKPRVE